MAEPVIVPIQLEVTDIDMSGINFGDVQKDISKNMSSIKKSIQDAFSGIDASAINKPIESAMNSVKKSVQAAEDAQLRYNEALIRAGSSTEEYKSAVNAAKSAIANQAALVNELSKLGPAAAPFLADAQKELDKLIEARNKINPLDFVDKAQPIQLEKIANAYKKVLSAQDNVNTQSEKFNQVAKDNKLSDDYTELLKQAEAYKKKLEDLDSKAKRMEALGATDKQWEALRYDTDQVSSAMDVVIKKMREAVTTGQAFRFGDGNKGELSRQINSLNMSAGNRAGNIRNKSMSNQSPYTEDYQKALDDLDKLEKKMEAMKEKSAKMIELGASKKQFESLVYDVKQLNTEVHNAHDRLAEMVNTGKAFKFGNGDSKAEIGKINDKSASLITSLTGVANRARKAQGGLTALGATHPKLAAVLGVVGKIASGFKKVASTVGRVAASVARMTSGLISGVRNMLSFGKAGRSTSNDLSKRFKKLGRNILMFGFGFRTAYYAVKRLRSTFVEGFKTMGDQFDEVGKPMTQLIESFNRLKGSLATAFQPLVSIVMPILTKLMNYLSGLFEAIGKFNAVLTGQGYIYKAIAKDVDSVAKSAKNANKQLGSYDKLDVIQNNDTGYEYGKESIGEVESAASNFARMVKEAWEKADFTSVGQYVTEQLLKVLDNAEKNLVPRVTSFVNKLLKSINTFLTGFDAKSIGGKLSSVFNAIVYGIDWAQVGMLFANITNTLWEFLDGLVNGIDWAMLGQAIAEGAKALFDTLNTDSWAGTINGLIIGLCTLIIEAAPTVAEGLVGMLISAVTKIDWANIISMLFLAIQTVLQSVGNALVNSDNPLLAGFGEVVLAISEAIELLRPAIEAIIDAIGPIIEAILPAISTLLPPIAEIVSEVIVALLPSLVELFTALMPPIIRLVDALLPILKDSLVAAAETLAFLANVITAVVVPIFDVLVGVIEFVVATIGVLFQALNGEFDSVGDLFQALLKAWKSPINSIISAIESLVNGVVKGINTMIRALNKISFEIPSWVPGIGGKKFGFNLKEISEISIPRLAQGAVIPPNKEFLAVLGDQKNGTNIEAPLDTIKQALAEVLAEVGGGTREPIVLQVSGRTLAKVVWDEQEKRYKQTGHAMA